MKKQIKLTMAMILTVSLCATTGLALDGDFIQTGDYPTEYDWSVAGNWAGGQVPGGATYTAYITNGIDLVNSGAKLIELQNTGEQTTALPYSYTMERSSTNLGERVDRPARYKNLKRPKPHIKAPDFKKLLSSEYLDRLHEDRRTVIPFSMPKYHYTQASIFQVIIYRASNACEI